MKASRQLIAAGAVLLGTGLATQSQAATAIFWDHLLPVDQRLCEIGALCDPSELIGIGYDSSLWAGGTLNSAWLSVYLSDDIDIVPAIEIAQIEAIEGNALGVFYTEEVDGPLPGIEFLINVTNYVAADTNDLFTALLVAEQGDFEYHQSSLAIDYTPAPVPVPAAAWLFGSAVAGLAAMRKNRNTA